MQNPNSLSQKDTSDWKTVYLRHTYILDHSSVNWPFINNSRHAKLTKHCSASDTQL